MQMESKCVESCVHVDHRGAMRPASLLILQDVYSASLTALKPQFMSGFVLMSERHEFFV